MQWSVLFSNVHLHVHVSVHVIFKISNDHEDLANQPLKPLYLIFINDEKLEETFIFLLILGTVKIFYLWFILYSKHNQS